MSARFYHPLVIIYYVFIQRFVILEGISNHLAPSQGIFCLKCISAHGASISPTIHLNDGPYQASSSVHQLVSSYLVVVRKI
jgi:hypothetical protein